jgi:WD40 repeat protein
MKKHGIVFIILASFAITSCNTNRVIYPTTNTSTSLVTITFTPIPATITSTTNPRVNEIYKYFNIAISPDGKLLAISSLHGVQVIQLDNGEIVYSFEKEISRYFQGIYSYIAWSPDGKNLAVGKPNIGVRIWDTSSWEILADMCDEEKSTYELPGFAWSPNGDELVLGLGDGQIQIWDRNKNTWKALNNCDVPQVGLTWNTDGQIEKSNIGTDAGYHYAVWSPDKKNIYTFFDLGGGITDVYKYDLKFGTCCYSEIAWSTDSRYFAAAPEQSNEISVWDTQESKIVRQEMQGDMIFAFTWLPNNELLALGRMDEKVVLWNTNTGKILLSLEE